MKRLSLIIAAAGLVCASGAVLAQNTDTAAPAPTVAQAAPAAPASPAATDPGEEVICRRNRTTGSLTRITRICKTRNEWNNSDSSTRNNVNDMQRAASGGAMCRQDQAGGC